LDEALGRLVDSCTLDVADRAPDGLDLREVGTLLGISGEAVRLIERAALSKLRANAAARRLRDG